MLETPLPLIVPPPGGSGRCAECAAAVAPDQRYCLNCGEPVAPLADWAAEATDAEPQPEAVGASASASRLPAPRSTALMTLLVLALGVFIGGAFGPRSADTLADSSDQSVVVVAGSPAAPAVRPASPATPDATSSLADAAATNAAPAAAGPADAGTGPDSVASVAGAGDSGAVPPDSTAGTPAGTNGSGTPSGASQPPALPPVKHVFTVAMSTPDDAHLLGASGPPYLRSELVPRGARLAGFRAIAGGDLAARIALASGQGPSPEIRSGCPAYLDLLPGRVDSHGLATGKGCVFPRAVRTIATQLGPQGLAWRAYAQGVVSPCRHPAPGAPDDTASDRPADHFAVAGTPFLYFHSIIDTGDCNAGVVPVERLKDDLASAETTPNYAFIAPDRCHDGREGTCADGQPAGAAGAEAFLRQWIPAILASPAYRQDGLLIVVGGRGTQAGALLVSRYIAAGRTSRTRYDHYSLLRTVEDLFGLGHLGHAADTGTKALGGDVFTTTG